MKRLVLFVLAGGIAYTGYHYSVYGTLPWQPLPYLEEEDSAQGRINRLSSLYDDQIVYVFGPLDGREISNLRMELVRLREDLKDDLRRSSDAPPPVLEAAVNLSTTMIVVIQRREEAEMHLADKHAKPSRDMKGGIDRVKTEWFVNQVHARWTKQRKHLRSKVEKDYVALRDLERRSL